MNTNSIRNANGHWINTEVFKEEANHFKKYGYYCPDPWGSPSWVSYWNEQLDRTINGFSSGGAKITGDHYFYLNFSPIIKVEKKRGKKKQAKKIEGFPDFWDGDYNYYWATDIAFYGADKAAPSDYNWEEFYKLGEEEQLVQRVKWIESLGLEVRIEKDYLTGGYHIIVGKSRRKGYSYKNASKVANKYNNTRNSLSIIGAFLKEYLYPKGTMAMVSHYLNFLNEHTGWRKNRDYIDKQNHRKASFKETLNGIAIEKGYHSEVTAVTFKDNPDAARGKDAAYILLEEAGKFPNLKASYSASKPALEAGIYTTGQILIFGTGGDMESGTVDFADMFYNPLTYRLMPFTNIWDDDAEASHCGFFHPVYWNMDGCYDEQGNSNIEKALEFEKKERDTILHNSSSGTKVLQQRVQEYPTKPSEAFLTVSTNDFPVVELNNRLNLVEREGLFEKHGQPVYLMRNEEGKVIAKPDLKKELEPVWHYKPKTQNLSSCPIIVEYPIPDAPKGLYKIGYDPYVQDQTSGTSLAAIYVYKSNATFSYTRDQIVAWYVGRPNTVEQVHRTAMLLAELYGAKIMHENMIRDVRSYFEKKKKLHLLEVQPDAVISKNVKNSKVARVYGIHMNPQLKDAGAKYIKQWLLTERDVDEQGNILYNLDTIIDPGLLKELILFNEKGNFDRVMAFMMIMFQLEEEGEKEYNESTGKLTSAQKLLEFSKNWFKKSKW